MHAYPCLPRYFPFLSFTLAAARIDGNWREFSFASDITKECLFYVYRVQANGIILIIFNVFCFHFIDLLYIKIAVLIEYHIKWYLIH